MSPGQIDRSVVRRHLIALDAALQHLRRHAGKPVATLVAEPDALWAVERGLQLCAQNALDVATHLAASGGRDVPDYAAAVDALAALGVLTSDFAARFRAVAGFRNILVHAYLEIDPTRVHAILNGRLGDFEEFARRVETYVGRQP